MKDTISETLRRALPTSRRRRRAIERELRTHLEETQHELISAGWTREDAERESIARFGNLEEIAAGFAHAYRPGHRRRLGLAFGLSGALLVGAYGASGTLASAGSATHHAPNLTHVVIQAHHDLHR